MARGRVLLLEDDLALRGLLNEALMSEGYEVQLCDSFAEVRSAAERHAGDIVVADFWGSSQRTLPDNERLEIQQLTSLRPTVLLTGRTWAADVRAEELGARAVVRKPFDLDHLLTSVERAFGSR
jgi:two-component system, NtrC family, nitrogen regulation response regulator GlnG